jgi:hypothetical protein
MQIDEVDNLLLNMKAGLLPKDLTESEVRLLEDRYGNDWFTELGYTEDDYDRSSFDRTKLYF